jgi:hypothetical protein
MVALDGLDALVAHRLVQRRVEGDSVRVGMLHIVSEYAQEQLVGNDDAEAEEFRRAQAQWYLAYAEEARRGMHDSPAQEPAWLDRLDSERDNVRAALVWAVEHEYCALAVRMAAALGRYWSVRGYCREGCTGSNGSSRSP